MLKRFILILFTLAIYYLIPPHYKINAEQQTLSKTEVVFDFIESPDKKSFYPEVMVYNNDYSTGLTTKESYEFKDLEQAFPEGMKDSDLGETRTYLVNVNGKLKAYGILNWLTNPRTVSESLFMYDLETHNFKKMQDGGEDKRFRIYPQLGSYSISSSDRLQDISLYSLETGEVIKSYPRVQNLFLSNAAYHNFHHGGYRPEINSLLIKTRDKNNVEKVYQELPDGTTSEIRGLNYSEEWELQIGTGTFMRYFDKSYDQPFIAFSVENKFKILNQVGSDAGGKFSPNNKYFIMRETPKFSSDVTDCITVVDTTDGSILYSLPITSFGAYPSESGFTWYSDNMVSIHFNNLPGTYYIYLPTGQLIRNTFESNSSGDFSKLNGDISKLMSPELPPNISYNGKSITYTGQGPFQTLDRVWYVPARDFFDLIDASYQYDNGTLSASYQNNTATFDFTDKKYLNIDGSSYLPLNEVVEKLQLGMLYNYKFQSDKRESKQFKLFSSKYSEETFFQNFSGKIGNTKFPDTTVPESNVEKLTPATGEHKYYQTNYMDFDFKEGKLSSLKIWNYGDVVNGIEIGEDQDKAIQLLGKTGEEVTSKQSNIVSYLHTYNNYYLIYKFQNKKLQSVIFIPKKI